ncbi:MAG: hypothetical protein ABR968_11385 [Bacteroidales bacterium]
MKKIQILISLAIIGCTMKVNAQNDVDAIRYSMEYFGGTARYSGMGGAFGAVGADFSTLSTNPAGLGVYRKNEFTFTPSFYIGETSSSYNGNTTDDQKFNFNLGNFGMVLAFKTHSRSHWKSVNFGIGINRENNFNNSLTIKGTTNGSMMDMFAANAQGNTPDNLEPFSTQLAFSSSLIDTSGGTNYIPVVPDKGTTQVKTVNTSGSMQEMVLSLGANYNNRLYIGGTLGIPFVNYYEHSVYKETDNDPDTLSNYFQSFAFDQKLTTTGSGFNFKLGLIFVPINIDLIKVKIGAAFHSPTYYNLNDSWNSTMTSNFDNGNFITSYSPDGSFDYQIITPKKEIGSIAIQIGHLGTISADYEYVDYSEARIYSNSYDFSDVNNTITQKYTATQNIKVGAEVVLGMFSIRGGYDIYGSPYKVNTENGKRTAITAGFGIIGKRHFIDFGYVYSFSKDDYYLFNADYINAAKNKYISNNLLITLGLKF